MVHPRLPPVLETVKKEVQSSLENMNSARNGDYSFSNVQMPPFRAQVREPAEQPQVEVTETKESHSFNPVKATPVAVTSVAPTISLAVTPAPVASTAAISPLLKVATSIIPRSDFPAQVQESTLPSQKPELVDAGREESVPMDTESGDEFPSINMDIMGPDSDSESDE